MERSGPQMDDGGGKRAVQYEHTKQKCVCVKREKKERMKTCSVNDRIPSGLLFVWRESSGSGSSAGGSVAAKKDCSTVDDDKSSVVFDSICLKNRSYNDKLLYCEKNFRLMKPEECTVS